MPANEDLLAEARPYCDAETGEVLERIPDELMTRLRAAKLARGVPGLKNQKLQTHAGWYVFFSDQIRERVTVACREANHKRRRARKAKSDSARPRAKAADPPKSPSNSRDRSGLADFRQSRRSTK
jgi:hypothetical protein